MTGCYNPFAIQFLREKFLKCADAGYDSPKHIYIQRSGTFRGVANEAEVFDFFTKAGFAIVDTAKLTFAQQIQLFSRAEIVCGPHGAAFANAVWCKPGCKVVEFFAEDYLNGCFEWITEAVGAHHDFLICPSDPLLNIQVDTRGLDGLIHPSG
jgi:capsular polysaccharide biosynthesis protein